MGTTTTLASMKGRGNAKSVQGLPLPISHVDVKSLGFRLRLIVKCRLDSEFKFPATTGHD